MCFVLPRTHHCCFYIFYLQRPHGKCDSREDWVEVVFLVKYHYFYKTGRCEKKDVCIIETIKKNENSDVGKILLRKIIYFLDIFEIPSKSLELPN